MAKKDRIIIFDTTLRDGEQSPGATMNIKEKLEIAQQLARLGVDVIEAGFPISSIGDFEAVSAIAETVQGPVICGLAPDFWTLVAGRAVQGLAKGSPDAPRGTTVRRPPETRSR